jgi:2-oxoglutarate ferredoxin oxidoreductase subunit beta
MNTSNNYRSGIMPTWCPGCNNFMFFAQIQRVLAEQKIESHNLVFCYDIGCSGNLADFLKCYGYHTLHGRSIPVAMGIKLINPKLTVCVYGGDGGTYGEGLNHLIAAARANSDIKIIVSNNYLYSLTTGQTSPTTPFCAKTKSTPLGNPNQPLDPIKLIKAVNPEVWAKTVLATDVPALSSAMDEMFTHKGFCLLDISMTCLAFGKQLAP